MGKPSATEPWGWQLDGHHAIINYFVLGDQVVMTPLFRRLRTRDRDLRANTRASSILQEEQSKGFAMIRR